MGKHDMKVYLASALSNKAKNLKLCQVLQSKGFDCFLPQQDTDQSAAPTAIALENKTALLASDLVVVLGIKIGRDTSWEAGLALGNRKPTIFLSDDNDKYTNDYMVKHGDAYLGVISLKGKSDEVIVDEILSLSKSIDLTSTSHSFDGEAFKYSMDWFKHHAEQRYKSFQLFVLQLFLAPLAFLASSAAKTDLTTEPTYWFILACAFALSSLLSYLFYKLDIRNRRLVKLGEASLLQFENFLFAEGDGILLKDKAEQSESRKKFDSHSKVLHTIFKTSMAVSLLITFYSAGMFVTKLCYPQPASDVAPIKIEIVQ